ncbi:secreted effector protein [Candidatus Symbiopectobacterium sp. 'North America']|nr:secreted effector protein [Candidatus Symbiopectobacterium sp. 'North America']
MQTVGLAPEPLFLAGCGLRLGQHITLPPYRLVFRVQSNALLICSLTRLPDCASKPSSLLRLWRLLQEALLSFSSLRHIRMLVITDVLPRRLALQRQKLVRRLCQQGAVTCLLDGERWLEIDIDRIFLGKARS